MRLQLRCRSLNLCLVLFAFSMLTTRSAYAAEDSPPTSSASEFQPKILNVPDGFSSQLVAGPPLVTHPTMACFDDIGRLFVCNNAGVNMSAPELEEHLPNSISMLEDLDGDGTFDKSTVFADKMTFPMGGAWHNGALYVASPPNIWRLQDTTGDGVADKRDVIVDRFGYTGNAASVHGCFFSPDGRLYWCDGYHGHEFKDEDGNVTSSRKGSYIFSCWPDGSDVRIHCGGGMDNPVEVDFTEEGDIIGTVNIMYSHPRIDCLVHWQYGGTYPHRAAVLDELMVTGDLLEPIHKFGHVAISGTMRYRSGILKPEWKDNYFATEFNVGKIVRVETKRQGSTYACQERNFLSCDNRDFHPTDVLEDADGSLLVIDTGGWFYRGCPTSKMAKPDVLGGIYRIRNTNAEIIKAPRGNEIHWDKLNETALMEHLSDPRFAVREKAIQESVRRGEHILNSLEGTVKNSKVFARRNAVWAATRIFQQVKAPPIKRRAAGVLHLASTDHDASVRQTAWHAANAVHMLSDASLQSPADHATPPWKQKLAEQISNEPSAAVRREAYPAFSGIGNSALEWLFSFRDSHNTNQTADREERHSLMYAVIEAVQLHNQAPGQDGTQLLLSSIKGDAETLIVCDQILKGGLPANMLQQCIATGDSRMLKTVSELARKRLTKKNLTTTELTDIHNAAAERMRSASNSGASQNISELKALIKAFGKSAEVAEAIVELLSYPAASAELRTGILEAVATEKSLPEHASWQALIKKSLSASQNRERIAAVNATGALGVALFADILVPLARNDSEDPSVRLAALATISGDAATMATHDIVPLLVELVESGGPLERSTAAQLLGAASLTELQLESVAPLLAESGPQQLTSLVPLFKRKLSAENVVGFLENIENARSLNSLPVNQLTEIFGAFPGEFHDRTNAVLDKLKAMEQQKVQKLKALTTQLSSGNPDRGREVFFSEKAKCATCHVVGKTDNGLLLGKRVGPDLTTIGANRAPADLLESIVFPSATLVRQYEPFTVLTIAGRTYSGIVIRETSEALTLQQSTGEAVVVTREDIDELIPGTVSIMPKGLDEALSAQQISDLVAWLQSLR